MASMRPLIMMARARPVTSALLAASKQRFAPTTYASFSTTSPYAATPAGPPPAGFRTPPPKRWDDKEGEGALDKAGKFFLMTEIFRGMWVVLEQYFRPP
jgi:NADH dehydrogenase (ubiquinone) Fe-S protein 8